VDSGKRDQSVERLLRQSRPSPQDAGVTEACLDAETAAAWVDGNLSGAALETAQSHLADCGRCQTVIGTLTRINAVVLPAERERASRRWLAWVVPLTAATAAVVLWVAVPRDKNDRVPPATEVRREAAEPKAQEPAPLDERAQGRTSGTMSGNRQGLAATKEAKGSNQPQGQTSEPRRDAERFEADSLKPQAGVIDGAITPSAQTAPTPGTPAAAPAPATAPALPLAAEKAVGFARKAESPSQAAGIEIVSPDASVRWRIAGSVVQRSTNGGSSWEALSIGIEAELTAGAAPSASVCWLVGRGGVVLVSTDSRSWRRVAFPEATDLSAIRATDARVASVSTADGRTFGTTDGGVTWVRRPNPPRSRDATAGSIP
jgi:hypothetical protein